MNKVTLAPAVIEEIKRIIRESEVTKEDDKNWPPPDRVRKQELEIKLDNEHISFNVSVDESVSLSFYAIFFVD